MSKTAYARPLRGGAALSVLALLVGCGTPRVADFGGEWSPVNRLQNTPTEIPLATHYVFYAAPIDQTLKTMLTRWAEDSGLTLVYLKGSDFTLYGPVTRIRTANLQAAIDELNAAYAAQDVSIVARGRQLVVQSISDGGSSMPDPAAPRKVPAVPAPAAG